MTALHSGYFTLVIGWRCAGVGEGEYVAQKYTIENEIPGWLYHYLDGNMACDDNREFWLTEIQRDRYTLVHGWEPDSDPAGFHICYKHIGTAYFKLIPMPSEIGFLQLINVI